MGLRKDIEIELAGLYWRRVDLELSRPLVTSVRRFDERSVLLLRLDVEVGDTLVRGFGEVAPLEDWTDETIDDCEEALQNFEPSTARCHLGPSKDVDEWEEAVHEVFSFHEFSALRFGVEVAILDAVARHERIPLRRLLSTEDTQVADEVAVQYTLGVASVDETVDYVEEARDRGFECVKLKVGAGSIDDDVARVAAVRRRCPHMTIRLDANGAYSLDEARRLLKAIASLEVDLVEQPVAADDVEGLAKLKSLQLVDVAADEGALPSGMARQMVRDKSVDALVLKPTAMGGLLPVLSIIDEAKGRDIRVILSTLIESAVGRRAVAQLAACRPDVPGPHGLATGGWFVRDVLPEPDRIEDGKLQLADHSGLGVFSFSEATSASNWRGGPC